MASYDASTALLVIDVQNDFADPAGSLYVRGGEDVVPLVNAEVARATEAGAPVFYTLDCHPETTPHFQKDGGIWPVHCVQGTWGAELHPDLRIDGPVVRKGINGEDGYSGFTMRHPHSGEAQPTELEALLAARGVERVVVCGLATDYCVKASVLDARALGYPAVVLAAAIRAVELEPGDGARAIDEMMDAGASIEAPA